MLCYNYKYNTKYVTLRPQKCCELGELEAGDVLLRVSINIILRYSGLLFFSICVLQLYGFIERDLIASSFHSSSAKNFCVSTPAWFWSQYDLPS